MGARTVALIALAFALPLLVACGAAPSTPAAGSNAAATQTRSAELATQTAIVPIPHAPSPTSIPPTATTAPPPPTPAVATPAPPAVAGPAPAGTPAALTVAEVYRRTAQALARPGLLYHATIQMELDHGDGRGTGATQQWVDAARNVAREEVVMRMAWEGSPAGPQDMAPQTSILTDRARYMTGGPGGRVEATGPARCGGASVAAVAVLGCPGGGMREATTTVESGRYAGRAALILVTAGSFCCERRGTATSRLYLDPDTCLPLALESDGQLEFDVSGPGGGRREVRPTRTRADYAHEFLPADAVPADFFDPAAIGYVTPAAQLGQLAPGTPVYWLGERFAGSAGLPPLALDQVETPPGGAGPGYRFILHYRGDTGAGEQPGPVVSLQEWPRATWDAFLAQAQGRNQWDDPCWAREELALPSGRATLFLGFESGVGSPGAAPGRGCPARPPDQFLAHAYLGETVVVLYASHANTPDGTVLNPYNTRAGIEAVLRALGPR